ncbi:MAG: glycosyltransferase family 2 protein [Tolumonas sp.]|nr:glycosyltransferase family 2 protein [Tolumonas sp.]
MKDKTCGLHAVVVTFNPNIDVLYSLIKSISIAVDVVWIIDNGSSNPIDSAQCKIDNSNIHVVAMNNNLGIAKAQNIGIKRAIKSNAKNIIFFDQDSQPSLELIENLLSTYTDLTVNGGKVACVGPAFKDPRFYFTYPIIRLNRFGIRDRIIPIDNGKPIPASFIISSGSLVPVDVIEDVGYFREDFFIDYVDTEWCMRAQSKGYEIYVSPSAVMFHSIGDDNIKFIFWKLPVHSAFRRYYRMRNMFYLFKLPYVPLVMKLREFITNNVHQLLIVLVSKNKMEYMSVWWRSLCDGFRIMVGKI